MTEKKRAVSDWIGEGEVGRAPAPRKEQRVRPGVSPWLREGERGPGPAPVRKR